MRRSMLVLAVFVLLLPTSPTDAHTVSGTRNYYYVADTGSGYKCASAEASIVESTAWEAHLNSLTGSWQGGLCGSGEATSMNSQTYLYSQSGVCRTGDYKSISGQVWLSNNSFDDYLMCGEGWHQTVVWSCAHRNGIYRCGGGQSNYHDLHW